MDSNFKKEPTKSELRKYICMAKRELIEWGKFLKKCKSKLICNQKKK